MEKFVAIIFDDEIQAYAGAAALRNLHLCGDITVTAAAVVAKDRNGFVEVKRTVDEGPVGTAIGLGIGALLGLLAGPVAIATGAVVAGTTAAAQPIAGGVVLGGMTGSTIGALHDIDVSDVDYAALDEVKHRMAPGQTCVIAAVDETWSAPLNNRMRDFGGTVIRKPRYSVSDAYYTAEAIALDAALSELEEDLRQAQADNTAAVKASIASTKARITDNNTKIEARIDQMNADFYARLASIDAGIAEATEKARQSIVDQKAKLTADHEARVAKLRSKINVAEAVLAA